MHTDEDTSEKFILSHPDSADPTKWFLMRGKPFEPSDWERIESAENRLRPNMRATVWVCDDGTTPIVDWLPPGSVQRSRGNESRADPAMPSAMSSEVRAQCGDSARSISNRVT